MEDVLFVILCIALPVSIVWMVQRSRQNETNKKAEIMLKAIEAGVPVDMEQFKSRKVKSGSVKQDLLDKLSGACITSLIGVAFLIYACIGYFNPEWIDGRLFAKMSPIAGGIMLAVGIGLFITYFVGKKMLASEIEAEEKKNLGQE